MELLIHALIKSVLKYAMAKKEIHEHFLIGL